MKTLAEIEKLAEKLAADEVNRHDYPYDLDARELESIYLSGFVDCMKLMLEREEVAKDALKDLLELHELELDRPAVQYGIRVMERLK